MKNKRGGQPHTATTPRHRDLDRHRHPIPGFPTPVSHPGFSHLKNRVLIRIPRRTVWCRNIWGCRLVRHDKPASRRKTDTGASDSPPRFLTPVFHPGFSPRFFTPVFHPSFSPQKSARGFLHQKTSVPCQNNWARIEPHNHQLASRRQIDITASDSPPRFLTPGFHPGFSPQFFTLGNTQGLRHQANWRAVPA